MLLSIFVSLHSSNAAATIHHHPAGLVVMHVGGIPAKFLILY